MSILFVLTTGQTDAQTSVKSRSVEVTHRDASIRRRHFADGVDGREKLEQFSLIPECHHVTLSANKKMLNVKCRARRVRYLTFQRRIALRSVKATRHHRFRVALQHFPSDI